MVLWVRESLVACATGEYLADKRVLRPLDTVEVCTAADKTDMYCTILTMPG